MRLEVEQLSREPDVNSLLDFVTHTVIVLVNPPVFAASVIARTTGGLFRL